MKTRLNSLFFRGDSNKSPGKSNKRQNSVKDEQIKSLIIDVHSLPFLAKYSEIQPFTINIANPYTSTCQLTLSTENTGTITDATATIAKLPNKVESALNSDREKFTVSKAFFYYGKDSKNKKQANFLNKLRQFGYTLRVKEVKRYGKRTKANCDVDLTMDMLLKIKDYKRAIVLSKEVKSLAGGNLVDFGSLRYLLEYKKRGRP